MSSRLWDRAGSLPVQAGERARPELVALPAVDLPDIDTLFAYMRDSERRFDTLRMRIEEYTATALGEQLVVMDAFLRHPGAGRVTTTEPARGTVGNYEVWISDGRTVRTYSAEHRLATERPVRRTIRGVDDPDLPGMSHVYWPITPLQTETLPDLFVHPGGYCQNVLATGACAIVGTTEVIGREAILLRCAHPRAIERVADRPDFAIELSVDRDTGCILRLVELMAGGVTRDATAVVFEPDASLPPSAFSFTVPEGTTTIF
jgi:outer membrane lipoprotein-sorting protein